MKVEIVEIMIHSFPNEKTQNDDLKNQPECDYFQLIGGTLEGLYQVEI